MHYVAGIEKTLGTECVRLVLMGRIFVDLHFYPRMEHFHSLFNEKNMAVGWHCRLRTPKIHVLSGYLPYLIP